MRSCTSTSLLRRGRDSPFENNTVQTPKYNDAPRSMVKSPGSISNNVWGSAELTGSKKTLILYQSTDLQAIEEREEPMALAHIKSTAAELLSGLPHRLDHVFRPWSRSSPHQPALIG